MHVKEGVEVGLSGRHCNSWGARSGTVSEGRRREGGDTTDERAHPSPSRPVIISVLPLSTAPCSYLVPYADYDTAPPLNVNLQTEQVTAEAIPARVAPPAVRPPVGMDPKEIVGGVPSHFQILGYPDLIRHTPITPLAQHLLRMPSSDRVLALMKRRYPDFSLDVAPFLPPAAQHTPQPAQTAHPPTAPTSATSLKKIIQTGPLKLKPRSRNVPGSRTSRAWENPGFLPPAAANDSTKAKPSVRGYGPGAVREVGLGAKVVNLGKNMVLGFEPRKAGKKEMARLEVAQFQWLTEGEKEHKRRERVESI